MNFDELKWGLVAKIKTINWKHPVLIVLLVVAALELIVPAVYAWWGGGWGGGWGRWGGWGGGWWRPWWGGWGGWWRPWWRPWWGGGWGGW